MKRYFDKGSKKGRVRQQQTLELRKRNEAI